MTQWFNTFTVRAYFVSGSILDSENKICSLFSRSSPDISMIHLSFQEHWEGECEWDNKSKAVSCAEEAYWWLIKFLSMGIIMKRIQVYGSTSHAPAHILIASFLIHLPHWILGPWKTWPMLVHHSFPESRIVYDCKKIFVQLNYFAVSEMSSIWISMIYFS